MRYQLASYVYNSDCELSTITKNSIFKIFRILENVKMVTNHKFNTIIINDNFSCNQLIELSQDGYNNYCVELFENDTIYTFFNKYNAIKFINEYLERYYNFMY